MSTSGSTGQPTPKILWELVEESFDEAEFLWRRWEDSLYSHSYDLAKLHFWIEERLLGCLEGVRVGGDDAFEPLIAPALASDQPWRLAVAAHVAGTGDGDQARQVLLVMISTATGKRLAMLRRAVELVSDDARVRPIEQRLSKAGIEQKAALLDLRSFRRRPPGPELEEVLHAPDPLLRAAAIRAARYVPAGQGLPLVQQALEELEFAPRNAAIESGLVLGSQAAWTRCLELVRAQAPGVGPLLHVVAQLGKERDQDLVLASLGNKVLRRDALFALGHAGTRRAADACAEAMAVEEDAKLAAEALCSITGLNLETERMIAPDAPPPDEPIPFEQEDLDEDVVRTPDDLLPAPIVERVTAWWNASRSRFADGTRYMAGKPVTLAALQEGLQNGPLRRSHAMSLELSIRTGGSFDVQTNAFTDSQRTQLRELGDPAPSRAVGSALLRVFSRC